MLSTSPAMLPGEREGRDSAAFCEGEGMHHVGTVARGRDPHDDVLFITESFYLTGKDRLKSKVIRTSRQNRGIRRKGERGQALPSQNVVNQPRCRRFQKNRSFRQSEDIPPS